MHLSSLTLLVLIFFLIIISAFFSSSEIGVMSLNRYRLRHLVKQKHLAATRIDRLLMHPERLLSVILIGNTLCNVLASMAATLIGEKWYGEKGVFIATAILTLILLLFSEMIPKIYAALYAQKVAFSASIPLTILQWIFRPLIDVISFLAKGSLKLFGVSMDQTHKDTLSGDELRFVVNEAGALLPVEHKGMLLSLLDLQEALVEEIMVPKAEIIGIDLEDPWPRIIELIETTQHTRLPLYRHSVDNLIGMVHLRSLLHLLLAGRLDKDTLVKISEPPYFIPQATPLNIQLLNFQKMKRRICFVVNEYGDLQGLVTMEDILEEVVGEFTTDIADMSQDVTLQADGSYIIDGSITLRHLTRLLHWTLPDLGPRTLSGLIIEYLGYIPPAECCLKIASFQIEILKVSDNMIRTVIMRQGIPS